MVRVWIERAKGFMAAVLLIGGYMFYTMIMMRFERLEHVLEQIVAVVNNGLK